MPLVPSGSAPFKMFCALVLCPLIPTSPIVTYTLLFGPMAILPPFPIAPGVARRSKRKFGIH
jgi:hypothetical protein